MTMIRVSPALILLVMLALIICAIVAVAPTITPDIQHSLDRHGTQAVSSFNCFNGEGTINPFPLRNPINDRTAWMCQMEGSIFIWITEKTGDTVTMFKNKSATFEQAIKYLLNRGYTP
jgi:hypothetical protein